MVDYDARYRKGWAYGKEPSAFLQEVANRYLPDTATLDIVSLGEGQGRNAVYLASLGHRCLAVDTSAVGLAKAAELAAQRDVTDRVTTLQTCVETFDVSASEATPADGAVLRPDECGRKASTLPCTHQITP